MSHIIEYLLYWFLLSTIKLSFYIHAVNWIWIACVYHLKRDFVTHATFFKRKKRGSKRDMWRKLLYEEAYGMESIKCKGNDLWVSMEVHRKTINLWDIQKKFFRKSLKKINLFLRMFGWYNILLKHNFGFFNIYGIFMVVSENKKGLIVNSFKNISRSFLYFFYFTHNIFTKFLAVFDRKVLLFL